MNNPAYRAMMDDLWQKCQNRVNEMTETQRQAMKAPEPASPRPGARKRVLVFPEDSSLGNLCVRGRGRKRWKLVGPAQGRVCLDPKMEYKLHITKPAFTPQEIIGSLAGIDCRLLAEIEASLFFCNSDSMDQAGRGISWFEPILVFCSTEMMDRAGSGIFWYEPVRKREKARIVRRREKATRQLSHGPEHRIAV